jgi:hypothetical protein
MLPMCTIESVFDERMVLYGNNSTVLTHVILCRLLLRCDVDQEIDLDIQYRMESWYPEKDVNHQ